MRKQYICLIVSGALVILGVRLCPAAVFQGMGYLEGGTCSEAAAVSADGSVVVGVSCISTGVRAFRWTQPEGIVPIPVPSGLTDTWAVDVSADGGSVLCYGRATASVPYGYEGFIWHTSGTIRRFALPDTNVIPGGMSADASVVVGSFWQIGGPEQAFRWTSNDGFETLQALAVESVRSTAEAISDDGSAITGHRIYDGAPYRDCFHWTSPELLTIDAHTANAVSADGSVVVGGLDNHDTSLFEAYRWTAQDGPVLLGSALLNYHSRALSVSGDGSIIVGYVQNNSGYDEQKAFIWDSEHGMRLLQDVLEDDYGLDLSGWKLSEQWASWKASAISTDGSTIVGTAIDAVGQRQAWRAVLQKTLYVDADAVGLNNGSSWTDAFNYLQDALMFASAGTEIRVAHGIYRPGDFVLSDRPNLGQAETFRLINGVAIKGGYAGYGEPDPDVRNIVQCRTVLTGDLQGDDMPVGDAADLLNDSSRDDNCFHVVTAHNTDATAALDGFTITGGNANHGYWVAYYGGGITADSAGFTLVDCTVEGNIAAQGGGLQIGSGGATLSGCTFRRNAAIHAGGMINGGRATALTDCRFIENYAETSGGAVISTDAVFTRCSFIGNRGGVSSGGAVNNDCSALKFFECTFTENTSPYAGGALYNYEGDLEIIDCTFTNNSSPYGGAIYQGDTDTVLTGCRFVGNESLSGGAIANDGYSDPVLTDCSFTDNRAGFGGAFYNTTGSAPRMSYCSFTGNVASDGGGAIASLNNYLFGMVIDDCTFTENASRLGGAIYNDQSDPQLSGCTFEENSCSYEGGGFYDLSGNPALTDCVFVRNRSAQDGGGMQNDGGTPALVRCVFTANFAADEGAGMCNEDNNLPPLNPRVLNCIFANNVAYGEGGGISNDGSSPAVINCTFHANSARTGGAVSSKYHSYPIVANSILFGDQPDELSQDDSSVTVSFSSVSSGEDNIDEDPLFADPQNGDYHLKSHAGRWDASTKNWVVDDVTSPCIDSGDPATPVGYEPFPNGGVINRGAYGGTVWASKSCFGGPVCTTIVAGDINGDCAVNLTDFAFIARNWLTEAR